MPLWLFKFIGMPTQAVPIKMPFSAFQYSANDDEYTNKPRKI